MIFYNIIGCYIYYKCLTFRKMFFLLNVKHSGTGIKHESVLYTTSNARGFALIKMLLKNIYYIIRYPVCFRSVATMLSQPWTIKIRRLIRYKKYCVCLGPHGRSENRNRFNILYVSNNMNNNIIDDISLTIRNKV